MKLSEFIYNRLREGGYISIDGIIRGVGRPTEEEIEEWIVEWYGHEQEICGIDEC